MPEKVMESMDAVQKGGYSRFELKIIHEQAQVARELFHLLDGSPDVQPLVKKMKNARHLYLIGYGMSYHAAAVGSVYIVQNAPAVGYEDVGIFVSQSGERMCSTRWKPPRSAAWYVFDWRTWWALR